MTLVDSNVLIDITGQDPEWFEWSARQFALAADAGGVAINPVIYAEVAESYEDRDELEAALPAGLVRLPLPYEAAWLAGQAQAGYRRRGGTRTSPLADFHIGAHAEAEKMRLLTRDVARFRTNFPSVELITPEDAS